MLKNGDICPICGEGKVSEQSIKGEFEYKGKKLSIPEYHVFVCEHCKEQIVAPKTLRATEKILTDFRRKIDGLLTSDEIKAIRKKLGKTQMEMATWLGVGKKNFARYETGKVTQGKTMDKLLRILNEYPNILYKVNAIKKQPRNDYHYEIIGKPFIYPKWGQVSLRYIKNKGEVEFNGGYANAA